MVYCKVIAMFLDKTFPSKLMSKTTVKLFGMLALALALNACGEDKQAQTKPSAEATPKTVAEKAPETKDAPQPAQNAQSDTTQVDEKSTKADTEKANAQQADDKKTEDKQTDEKKADEKKADDKKANVKALSIEEGKKRYETTCKVCHEQGLLDAPKLTDKANWAKRLEKGVDTLHNHSAKGFNKMPAQVTADVSEAEVYAAVDYMVSQVK